MFGALMAAAVLTNAAMEIHFAPADRAFAVERIVNKSVGHAGFVNGAAKGAHLFRLEFSCVNSTGGVERVFVGDDLPCRAKSLRIENGTALIELKGYDLPGESNVVDVTASVTLQAADTGADWDIDVACRSAKWALAKTIYPCLRGVVKPGEADVLLPHMGLGATLHRNFDGNARKALCAWGEYECPSYFPMITAYMIGEAGLVIFPDDPDARIKKLWVNHRDLWYETPVENAGVVGRAASGPKYKVRTEVYRGDWWQAAKIYRKWAMRQKWCRRGPIITRADYPKTMKEPSIWFSHYWWGASGFIRYFENIHREAPDVKVGVRWYDWSLPGFGIYPEALPAKEGVDEVGEALKRLGYVAMPYINARIWDSILLSYNYAQKDMCMRPDGKPFTEQWGTKGAKGKRRRRDYGIMCPTCPDWQAVMRALASGTVEATSAAGVYYDQLGCAAPRECRNPAHGHPLGGGRWWTDGNREIMRQARQLLNPRGIAITTEGTAEYYMDDCDGFLVVTTPMPDEVPFFPAVYSGYTTYFGTRLASREPFELVFPLMAREFVSGLVNGWSDDWRGNPKVVKKNCDAAIMFARARQKYAEYFVYGSLLGELKALEPLPQVPYMAWSHLHRRKDPITAHLPAVVGTWWRTRGERPKEALIAVNVSDKPQTVRFNFPDRQGTGELTLSPYTVGHYELD